MSEENKSVNTSESEEKVSKSFLEPSDLWKGVVKFWWVAVVLGVICSAYMFYTSYSSFSPEYTASATFTVNTQAQTLTGEGLPSYSYYYDNATATQLAETFPYILSSNMLTEAIYEDLGIAYMPVALSAEVVSTTNMFVLTATGSDPLMTYDVLISAMNNYPQAAKYLVGNVVLNVITVPTVPAEPSNKFTPIVALEGLGIGFLIGCAWIVVYALIRNTIKTKNDVKVKLQQELVGTVPEVTFKKYKTQEIDYSILMTNKNVGKGFLESMRLFRNRFSNALQDDEKVVMATSTAQSEGKTTVIANLALSLKDVGKKILLVDADLRNPSVDSVLKFNSNEIEYTEVEPLYSKTTLEDYGIDYLKFTNADKEYWTIIKDDYLKDVFDKYRDEYDYILVDTPPCGLISDTATIAEACDAAIYIVLQDTVRAKRILNGLDSIMHTKARVLGVVINGALSGLSGYGENYGYGYRYGNYGHYKNYSKYGYGYGYGYGYSGYDGYGYGGYGYGYGYGGRVYDKKYFKSRKKKGEAIEENDAIGAIAENDVEVNDIEANDGNE